MLLTVTLSGPDAPGLGYLLHKHPERVQTFELPVGTATVFYPHDEPDRATCALLLEVDPVGLVRGRDRAGATLVDYVTDRPYAASSLLAVALGRVFKSALNGRCDARPELAASPLPLEIRVPALPARPSRTDPRAGTALVRVLFEPLGWQVDATQPPLRAGSDGPDAAWGPSPYVDLTMRGRLRLADALAHLYVLLPVLDDAKHYWVSPDEVDKLIRRGEGWLATHPERALITERFVGVQRSYVADARARLDALDAAPTVPDEPDADTPPTPTTRTPLATLRREAVLAVLAEVGARRVVDLGCGEGVLVRALALDPAFTEVVGVDVSPRELARAERRLNPDRLSDSQRAKVTLRQGSVTYRDDALAGFDAILLVEVVEHLDPDRLAALEASVFGAAHPTHVVVTTPNREFNAAYGLGPDELRHPDHRFEWTRAEFAAWAEGVAARRGYTVALRGVGEELPDLGTPTQLALFSREAP